MLLNVFDTFCEEYANIILEETNRLSNLSSNMIKISKFEHQEIITNKKEYRLDEQIRKAIITRRVGGNT